MEAFAKALARVLAKDRPPSIPLRLVRAGKSRNPRLRTKADLAAMHAALTMAMA